MNNLTNYDIPSNFLFLEKTFDRLATTDEDRCEVFGGALRDQLLGVKEVDIDIKITKRLYEAFVIEMKRQFRLVSRTCTRKNNDARTYTRVILVINTPTQQSLSLDINFFKEDDDYEDDNTPLDENVDFTVNNLRQSLIGENKGKLFVRIYPSSSVTMSYNEWLTECIRDVFTKRLRCIYDNVPYYFNIKKFVKWHAKTFEYRYKRLEKMKSKESFKDAKVEYLTNFRFDQKVVYGEFDDIIVDDVKEDNCPVCMVSWEEIITKIITLNCRHTFCVNCLDKHMNSARVCISCPICKQVVETAKK
jgi:hypothetical protein